MITTFTDIQHISSTSPNRFKRRLIEGWDGVNCGFLTDSEPAVKMNSDTDRPVELITYLDTGQDQRNLPPLCPSPQAGRTGTRVMASMKRRPSPTEDREPEQQSRTELPGVKPLKMPCENWSRAEFIYYCSDTDSVLFPDLSIKKLSMLLILRTINYIAFTTQTDDHFDSDTKNIIFKQNTKMFLLMESKDDKIKVKMKNQYAFFFFRKKDGSFTKPFGPYFPKDKGKVHSEDLVCAEIQEVGKGLKQYIELYIYTVYSPCMGRKNTEPCMIRLICLSDMLGRRYGIKTYITFSKHYGATGPICKCLPDHTYKKCSFSSKSTDSTYIKNISEPSENLNNKDKDPQSKFLKKNSSRYKKTDSLLPISPNKSNSSVNTRKNEYAHNGFSGQHSYDHQIKNTDGSQDLALNMNTVAEDEDCESKFLKKKSSRYKKTDLFGVMLSNESKTSIIKAKNDDDHNGFSGQHSYNQQTKIIDGDQDLVLNMNTVAEYEDHESKFLMKKSSRYKKTDSLLPMTPNETDIQMEIQDNSKFLLLQRTLYQQTYDQKLELARNLLIRERDRQSWFLMKISSRFKKNKLIYLVKENIPKDLRNVLFQQIHSFNPECTQEPNTFEEFEKKGMETSEEFEKSLRALISEEIHQSVCNSICGTFKSEFLNWWATNLEQSFSTFLNERLSEGINREVTRRFIHNIQQLPYGPIIGCIGDITDPEMCCSDAVTPSPDNPLS
ncbi:uncharacterized protein LOC118812756 [Colossoma macropomum]|uniref:uncharacterized protein LOC118812756 n=1 Tax=Colossoma macropomum TaxID=42526 RepID=UPI00186477AB|nr:uncharacterized protein LOC118812756 [Colossoma macropomum]